VEVAVSNSEGVALLRQIFEWLQQRDVDSFLAVLHPDVEAHPSIGGGAELHGRAEVAEWLREFAAVPGDLEARPLDFEEHGGCVLVRGYLRHRAGRVLAESQVYWLYEIRDGQVVRMESHASRRAAFAAC
jgi:ketosteroid isomerase-like protein